MSWSCVPAQQEITESDSTELASPRKETTEKEEISLSKLVDSLSIHKKELWIKVCKSDYKLEVKHGDKTVKEFKIVLGYNPVGDKMMQGDYKTPEGIFKIRDKYPHRNWTYFMWVDYPTSESYKRFEERKRTGKIPQSAKIGGEIGIHGVPLGADHYIHQGINWTFGCVSLTTKHIKELYDNIEIGAKVEIIP